MRATEKAELKLRKAKAGLLITQPFFGSLVLGLEYIENNNLPFKTMGVTGTTIYWDRNFVNETPLKKLQGTLCHEVMHLALYHLSRKKKVYQQLKWNIATDYAVNLIIHDAPNLHLPDGALYDNKYRDMTAEQIYAQLPDDMEYPQDADFRDFHGESNEDNDQEIIQRVIAAAELADAASAADRGYVPSSIRRLIEELKHPKIDWRNFIRASCIDIFSRKDYFWARGNRQFIHQGLYLPSLLGETNKTLVVAADTSGSIDQKILADFVAEIKGIVELADSTIVMSCDAQVHESVEITQFEDLLSSITLKGGGGTDFRPVFDKVRKDKLNPEVLIYLTDGWGRFPSEEPHYDVIFARIPNSLPVDEFPFGRVVTLED